MIYDPKSHKAEEFINHEEVLATLDYAEKNKNNVELIDQIIAKAKLEKGLSHREAAVLLDCDIPEKVQEIYALAEQIKKDFYGNPLSPMRQIMKCSASEAEVAENNRARSAMLRVGVRV